MILWQGQPDDALDFSGFWSGQTWIALVFTGFALFWIVMAFGMTGGTQDMIGKTIHVVFPLFGLPFLLVGLHMLIGRFWTDARRRRNSFYTLTNRAAYIGLTQNGRRSLERYAIGTHSRLRLDTGNPGSVWFADGLYQRPVVLAKPGGSFLRRGKTGASSVAIGFERIADARKVYDLMRQVQIADANPVEARYAE